MKWVHKCIRNVPPEVRAALVAEAAERGTNLRDTAAAILADHYEIEYTPMTRDGKAFSPAKTQPTETLADRTLILRLPISISDAIDADAFRLRRQKSMVVTSILADYFELGSNGSAPSGTIGRQVSRRRVPVGES